MKSSLLVLLFLGIGSIETSLIAPIGISTFPENKPDQKYEFFAQPLSWQKAVEQCELHNMQLLMMSGVEDGNERKWIQDQMTKFFLPDHAWTGLNIIDSREWRWLKSDMLMKGDHDEWESPDDYDKSDSDKCGVICKDSAKYRSKHCSAKYAFICKFVNPDYTEVDYTTKDGGCPNGWFGAADDNKCYRIHGHSHHHYGREKTWRDADAKCQEIQTGGLYPDLAHFSDLKSIALLVSKLGTSSSEFWIGLKQFRTTDGYQWAWSDNKPVDKSVLDYYLMLGEVPPTPSSGWDQGLCAVLSNNGHTTGQWIISACEAENENGYGYICQMYKDKSDTHAANRTDFSKFVTFGKDTYQLISDRKTSWEEANAICKESDESAHLASIYGEPANSFLAYALMETLGDAKAWIGFQSNSKNLDEYEWLDHGYPFYTKWGPEQPIKANDFGGCVYMHEGRWYDADCRENYNFFCKITKDILPTQPPITEGSCPLYDIGDTSLWKKHGGFCYYTSDAEGMIGQLNWENAQQFCQNKAKGAHLVSIQNEAENEFIGEDLLHGELERYWIGLRPLKDNSYVWVDETPLLYEKWAPDNKYNRESCGFYNKRNFPRMWSVANCEKEFYHFICKVPEGEPIIEPAEVEGICPGEYDWVPKYDSCYLFIADFSSFHNAAEDCKNFHEGAHLASIHSYAESEFIDEQMEIVEKDFGLPEADGSYWIGLERNGRDYEWLDKTELDYKNWKHIETDHESGEQCVKIILGQWVNVECSHKEEFTSFVCKMPKGKLPKGLSPGGITAIVLSVIVVILLLVAGLLFFLSSSGLISMPANLPFSKSYDRHTDDS